MGERIREGFKIAILGPTNAGKSSLSLPGGRTAVAAASSAERGTLPGSSNLAGFAAQPLSKPVKTIGEKYMSVDVKAVVTAEEDTLDIPDDVSESTSLMQSRMCQFSEALDQASCGSLLLRWRSKRGT